MDSYFIGIIVLLLSGIIGMHFSNKLKITILSVLSFIGTIFCLYPAINVLISGQSLIKTFDFNSIFGSTSFVMDSLSAFFIIIIAVMTFVSFIYAKEYLQPYIEKNKNINAHLIFLSLLLTSMLLVVTCQNALMFLICWEIMSLSSFFLVIFENEKKEVLKAGIKYLVFMHISVLFIIMAFAILSIKSGSLDFSTFSAILNNNEQLIDLVVI